MNIDDIKLYLEKGDVPLVLGISRSEHIEPFETQTVVDFLEDLKTLGSLGMNRLTIIIGGYDDDPRELIEIPEVVQYIQFIDRAFPYWFFFLELKTFPNFNILRFIFFCCCGVEIINRNSNKAEIKFKSEERVEEFIKIHYDYFNELMDELKLSDELNISISKAVNHILLG